MSMACDPQLVGQDPTHQLIDFFTSQCNYTFMSQSQTITHTHFNPINTLTQEDADSAFCSHLLFNKNSLSGSESSSKSLLIREWEKTVVRVGGEEGWGACNQNRQEKKARWLWEFRLFCRDGIFSVINRLESGLFWNHEDSPLGGDNLHFYKSRRGMRRKERKRETMASFFSDTKHCIFSKAWAEASKAEEE